MPSKQLRRCRIQKYKDFSRDHANLPWVKLQYFSSGRTTKEGLVLRHDFEGECTVRLQINLARSSSDNSGPFYVDLGEVAQRLSINDVVSSVLQAANLGASDDPEISSKHERRVRKVFTEQRFPFNTQRGSTHHELKGEQWTEEFVVGLSLESEMGSEHHHEMRKSRL